MNLAIIPARAGSKRIPRKNIKYFAGKPAIAYSIEAAIQSKLFDDVIVTTDDQEITAIAQQYGATVPFIRPANLCDDFVTTAPIIQHAAKWYAEHQQQPSNICCIYATAPFIKIQDISEAYQKLLTIDQGGVLPLTTFEFPIQRSHKLDESGHPTPFYPECMPMRSQDLEEAYHDVGQFYWWSYKALFEGVKERLSIILPRHRVQDLDTLEDWKRAELMYQAMQLSEAEAG